MDLRSKKNQSISGWGNFPVIQCNLFRPEKISQLNCFKGPLIARGLGRSYGDAALNSKNSVVSMERLNRFLDFDEGTGVLRAEAGVTIEEVLDTFVHRGWFVPVTPGTKHVTLGGCLAADVHGKNHHCNGVFSDYVKEITLSLANGEKKLCSPTKEPKLFWATVGGMGLTGIVTDISLQLIPIESSYMMVKNHATNSLESTLAFLGDPKNDDRYSVAWIDCLAVGNKLGRGIVMNGHHASSSELPSKNQTPFQIPKKNAYSIPAKIPSLFLNSTTIKLFNSFYYFSNSRKHASYVQDYQTYFYPLDAVRNWNRFYGKNGFVQYQFVVPEKSADVAIAKILEKLVKDKVPSFLAVLKRFGKKGKGQLSFPMEGYTLALDIPMSPDLTKVIASVDELVINSDGRVYLAKDALLQPDGFRAMYPKFSRWSEVKRQVDPNWVFSSDLSRRLKMEKG